MDGWMDYNANLPRRIFFTFDPIRVDK